MVHDVASGAAAVLLVLLLRIVRKDVYVTPNLRQGLRITQLNRTYQVYFSYRCWKNPADPLMCFSPQRGCATIWEIFRYVRKPFRIPYRGDSATLCYRKKYIFNVHR